MDNHVERSVLTPIETKTVCGLRAFFPGKKVFLSRISVTCKSLRI